MGGAICLFVNVLNAQSPVNWSHNGIEITPDANFDVKFPMGVNVGIAVKFPDGSMQNTAYSPIWERITGTNNIAYNFYGGYVGIGLTDPDANLQVSGKIRISNPSHKGCHLEMGQDGKNTYIEARALGMPNNGACNLLLNYYGHQPIGLYGETTVEKNLIANQKIGIGISNPISDLHIKREIANVMIENDSPDPNSSFSTLNFKSPYYNWIVGGSNNQFIIGDATSQYSSALFTLDKNSGNASIGEILPDAEHRLRITGRISDPNNPIPSSKAAILFTNANHNACQVMMGQDGANAVIDAGAPANISNCQLLLNYYNHRPIGVFGPMTCKKDVCIGGEFENNGLVIQNTGLETLQENKTDNINAIALKISHSGTDRWVVKGDGSLSITPYDITDPILAIKAPNTADNVFSVYDDGKLYAREIKVALTDPWADYVFEQDYNLMPLSDLRSYIFTHKHLPNMKSAIEMKNEGLDMEKTLNKQQEKIEELTLYILQLEERLNKLEGGGK